MNFIRTFDDDHLFQENILTDGEHMCSYKELPEVFDALEAYFIKQGIHPEMPLVLECENTLPAALTLLYLLENDYSFLLVSPASSPFAIPKFCRFYIKTACPNNIFEPDTYLSFIENKEWNGEDNKDAHGKLYLQTSGSTGVPKIVVHSHNKLHQNASNCIERLKLDSGDRIVIPVPIFHMFGLGAAFLPAVMIGASLDLQKGANLLKYVPRERSFKPNVAFMTPAFCETLLKVRKKPRLYRLTVTAGDRFRTEGAFALYESLFGCVVNLYGSTEMGVISVSNPDDSFQDRSETAGRAMPGVRLCIAEEKEDNSDTGELLCRHQSGFAGYIDMRGAWIHFSPQKTGWFATKDVARVCSDGRIRVVGRKDHCVNRDGLLVFFTDVETVLKKIEEVENAVVIASGASRRGEGMIACCVITARDSAMTKDDIRSNCMDTLPARAVPDKIIILDELPMLASGKIDRQHLVQSVS